MPLRTYQSLELTVEAWIRCVARGSFQPFLEALRGHEVVSLTSMPTGPPAVVDRPSVGE